MQLDRLKSAWQQMKLQNSMHTMDAQEILSIIEYSTLSSKSKVQKVLYNTFVFIILAIICQSG